MKSGAWWLDIILVVALIAAALSIRVPVALERKIMPAGDAFNLQRITDHIARFSYPNKENRLFGYPALILLTRPLPVDPVVAAVAISITLSTLTIVCLYFTGRDFRLHPLPLLTFLGLSLFDPILIVNSIRPLSDAAFIFWLSLLVLLVTRQLTKASPPTTRNLLFIGTVITIMIFTRYEGYLVAALVFPTLWIRVPWRKLLIAAAIPFFAVLLWIPLYLSIHGSLSGGYIAELSKPGNSFGGAADVPTKFISMLRGAGWGTTWTFPAEELKNDPKNEAVIRILTNPGWWISLLAVLGAGWLLIKQRTKALPLFLALTGYITVIVWWLVYSRFVAPLLPFFYLTAAAGGSLLISILSERSHTNSDDLESPAVGRRNFVRLEASLIMVATFFGWILWTEAPRLHKQGLGRAWEGNQNGYALFNAVRETAKLEESTAYWTEVHAFATLYLKEHGFFFSRHENESPQQIYEVMRGQRIQHIVDTSEEENLPAVVSLLKQNGNIKNTTVYRASIWADNSIEEVPVHHLTW